MTTCALKVYTIKEQSDQDQHCLPAKKKNNKTFCYTIKFCVLEYFALHEKLIEDYIEPHREKTGFLPRRKQRRRSASR